MNSLADTLSQFSLRNQLDLFQLLGTGCINNGFFHSWSFIFFSIKLIYKKVNGINTCSMKRKEWMSIEGPTSFQYCFQGKTLGYSSFLPMKDQGTWVQLETSEIKYPR